MQPDDTNEPIADTARSILDGHIVLSRKLTSRGHYPPVDVLQSLSRVMPMVCHEGQIEAAREIRELLAAYDDVEDLVSIGAYKPGSKPVADRALALRQPLESFLRQRKAEGALMQDTMACMESIFHEEV